MLLALPSTPVRYYGQKYLTASTRTFRSIFSSPGGGPGRALSQKQRPGGGPACRWFNWARDSWGKKAGKAVNTRRVTAVTTLGNGAPTLWAPRRSRAEGSSGFPSGGLEGFVHRLPSTVGQGAPVGVFTPEHSQVCTSLRAADGGPRQERRHTGQRGRALHGTPDNYSASLSPSVLAVR